MSLRWQLIISYIVIIVVTLALAFLTLVLIARPIQTRLATARLAAQSRLAALQIDRLYRQGVSTERILSRLDSWATQNRVHLVFVDRQGMVLADSQDAWVGQQLVLPFGDEAQSPSRTSAQTGSFNAPGGDRFMYAATPVGPAGERRGYIAVVAPGSPILVSLMAELSGGFLVAGAVALLVSLLLGILIARSIALPLQRIARAAGAVAAGDYAHRLQESGPPEVKRVAASFNVMVGRV